MAMRPSPRWKPLFAGNEDWSMCFHGWLRSLVEQVFGKNVAEIELRAGLVIEVDDFAGGRSAGRLKIDLGDLRTIGRARNSKTSTVKTTCPGRS